jgi:biopolymer transport protein ExbB
LTFFSPSCYVKVLIFSNRGASLKKTPLLLLCLFLANLTSVSAEVEESPFQFATFEKEEPVFLEETLQMEEAAAAFNHELFPQTPSLEKAEKADALALDLDQFDEPTSFTSKFEDEVALENEIEEQEIQKTVSNDRIKERESKSVAMAVPPAVKSSPIVQTQTVTPIVNFAQVFAGSPIVYSILLMLSVFALFVFLYNLFSVRNISDSFVRKLRQKLLSNQFEEALALCMKNDQPLSRMVSSAISARKHGLPHMIEIMKAEGKRATVGFWQKIALLNDIAIIAPMLGLLGTVLGMFYAFYDLNRSRESVNTLFDGLGISVGTTVGGLIVAIIAMLLHSFSKYRLMRLLARAEDEAQSLVAIMDTKHTLP